MPGDLLAFIEGQPLGIALAVVGLVAFLRGWIVPGYIYASQIARIDKLLEGFTPITAALRDLTDEIRSSRRAR